MKLNIVTLLLAALFAVGICEEVITLTTENFQKEIDNNPFILVEFYAPWCGHCKKLAPEYEKAAAKAKALDPKVVLAKVDATAEKDLATEYGVKGFPTLKWFVNGKVSEYSGGRTEDTIVSWVQKKTGPAAKTLKSVDDLKKFQEQADAVVVGFFKDEAEAKTFLAHAQSDDDTPYAVCYENCDALYEHAGIDKSRKLAVLQKFDEGKAEYDGDFTSASDIATFVTASSLPTIIPFSQKNAPKIFNGAIKSQMLVFVDDHESSATKSLLETVKPVADSFKGRLLFVSVDKKENRILEFFGVKESDVPAVRIVNMDATGAKKYKFDKDSITSEALDRFAEDYFAGTLKQDLKSEEPVPESEQGPVRVVVGKDFESVVSQPGKDVLVEFYAPWCGHCKKLEPEYTALGEHFKDNENIIIAKCDATANEVERVSISGFPTLKFFPADSDEIIDYDGARDKEGMIKFLEAHAKNLK